MRTLTAQIEMCVCVCIACVCRCACLPGCVCLYVCALSCRVVCPLLAQAPKCHNPQTQATAHNPQTQLDNRAEEWMGMRTTSGAGSLDDCRHWHMVAQPFSEYFRGVLVAENGRRGSRAERQTDRPRRGDGESGRQRAGRRVFTRFRLFHSNDIVLSVACWMKRKTETKIKNAKPQTKCCGNFVVGFAQCQWQQIINNFFWGNLCNLVYRVFCLCKLNFLT